MESTLSVAFTELQSELGAYAGYGRGLPDDVAWNATQQSRITAALKSGMRKFYFCGHTWSFLRPTASVTFVSAASTVALPDDFNGLNGTVSITNSSNTAIWPLNIVGEGVVREAYNLDPTATGWPTMISRRPLKGLSATQGQRDEFYIYPAADQNYTLTFCYSIAPDYLTGNRPYAYGGPAHAETLLQACKAAHELAMEGKLGEQNAEFARLLEISVAEDSRKGPQDLGRLRCDDDAELSVIRRIAEDAQVTFNGVAYD